MNKENNIRARQTKEKIERALMYLLKRKTFSQIYVKDICEIACINRSSFYEHYLDINDLMIKIEAELSKKMQEIFSNPPFYTDENFIKMFEHIKENGDFYKAYLTYADSSIMKQTDFLKFYKEFSSITKAKTMFNEDELIYHMAFFSAGLSSICKIWLLNGLKETPKQLAEIIKKEYNFKEKI